MMQKWPIRGFYRRLLIDFPFNVLKNGMADNGFTIASCCRLAFGLGTADTHHCSKIVTVNTPFTAVFECVDRAVITVPYDRRITEAG